MKRALLLPLLVAVVGGAHAHAATVLEFDPPQAASGERVTGTTVGAGMQGIVSGRVVVLLAPSDRVADVARGLRDPRLVTFGVMVADAADVGHFTGTVPKLEAGSYVAVASCPKCPGVFTVGEFQVTGTRLPRTGPAMSLWLVIGSALVAMGVYALKLGRRGLE